ncbi:MAG: FecR domain-containing protein [SAR324 cluster bacterium]
MSCGAVAAQYGVAVVEQGGMTLVRDGTALSYPASRQAVEVNERDLVRVREASRIVLKTRDHATLTLGANAVFQCEPWQSRNTTGILRMLFGRFRATVSGLAGPDRFNVKTATATIGVKGTEFRLAATSGGNSAVLGVENTVTNAGRDGVGQAVAADQISVVLAGNPSTPAATAPQDFKDAMRNLDSPPATSAAARDLPAEKSLVQKGIVSQEQLDKSKAPPELQQQLEEQLQPQQPRDQQLQQQTLQQPQPPINVYDAQQSAGAVKGKLSLRLER